MCIYIYIYIYVVREASPLIEGCEIVGAGCEPVRGAPIILYDITLCYVQVYYTITSYSIAKYSVVKYSEV